MITFFRLLQHVEVSVELLLGGPCGPVDSGQHRVVGIAAPVRAGHLHQLEGVPDLAGRGHVRPAAKVEPLTLLVDPDVLVGWNRVDQFHLVGFALLAKDLLRLVPAPYFLREGPVALDDLPHLLLDGGKVLRRERLVACEVVVEPVLDDRADGDLGAGPQLLHGLRQDVRGVVPDQFEGAGVVAGHDLDPARLAKRLGQVAQRSVQRYCHGLLRERLRDRFGERGAGRRGVVVAHGTVGKCKGNLGQRGFSYPVPQTSAGGSGRMRPAAARSL